MKKLALKSIKKNVGSKWLFMTKCPNNSLGLEIFDMEKCRHQDKYNTFRAHHIISKNKTIGIVT